jgi:hypothetical protein
MYDLTQEDYKSVGGNIGRINAAELGALMLSLVEDFSHIINVSSMPMNKSNYFHVNRAKESLNRLLDSSRSNSLVDRVISSKLK